MTEKLFIGTLNKNQNKKNLSSLYPLADPPPPQNQNKNSLLVKRQNDNTSPGDWPGKISPPPPLWATKGSVSKINMHLAFERILADCQHSFRSQRSCETQLVQFFHDLVSNLDRALNRNHRQTDVIIMDFAKALDKVGVVSGLPGAKVRHDTKHSSDQSQM